MKTPWKVLLFLTVGFFISQCAPPGEDSNPTSSIAQKGQNTQPTTQPLPAPAPAPANPQTPYGNTGLQTNTKTTGDAVLLNCLENNLSAQLQQLQDFTTSTPAPTCQNTSIKVNIQPVNGQTGYKLATNPIREPSWELWGYGKGTKIDPSQIDSACTYNAWITEFWITLERPGQKILLTQIWGRNGTMSTQYLSVDLQQGDDIAVYALVKTHLWADQCNVIPNPTASIRAWDNALGGISQTSATDIINVTGYKIYSLRLNFQ